MASSIKGLVSKAFSLADKEAGVLQTLHEDAQATVKRMTAADPGLQGVLDRAFGYAVFPSVGKAALVVGGAFGKGEVYRRKRLIGYAGVVQLTLGVQLGGQTFGEIIAFEDEQALERFKQGRTRFAANASAVLVKAGAAASARFDRGVAVFLSPDGGAGLELALGGQKFFFYPAVLGRGRRAPKDPRGRGGGAESKPAAAKKPAPGRAGASARSRAGKSSAPPKKGTPRKGARPRRRAATRSQA